APAAPDHPREELLEAARDPDDLLDVVPEARLVEPDADQADLPAGGEKAIVHAAAPEAGRRGVLEERPGPRPDAGDRENRIAGADGSRLLAEELQEIARRAPVPRGRRRLFDVAGLGVAEGKGVRRDEDRSLGTQYLP